MFRVLLTFLSYNRRAECIESVRKIIDEDDKIKFIQINNENLLTLYRREVENTNYFPRRL